MKYAVSPGGEEALRIANSRKPGSLLLMIGECRVRFKGRAEAFLDYGERLVMLKKDGSVLVHRGDGCDAVNWQPPGTKTVFSLDEGELVLHAYRLKPPEKLKIRFRGLRLIANLRMRDKAELRLRGMEKDYADRVVENPWIIEEGLRVIRSAEPTRGPSISTPGRGVSCAPPGYPPWCRTCSGRGAWNTEPIAAASSSAMRSRAPSWTTRGSRSSYPLLLCT